VGLDIAHVRLGIGLAPGTDLGDEMIRGLLSGIEIHKERKMFRVDEVVWACRASLAEALCLRAADKRQHFL